MGTEKRKQEDLVEELDRSINTMLKEGDVKRLKAPVAYQGAKVRLAKVIVDLIDLREPFYDLCCGSGAVSIEVRKRGIPAESIRMVDSGIWGRFWQAVGSGTFLFEVFRAYLDAIPSNREYIHDYMVELMNVPLLDGEDVCVYLILQAGAFGGKAIDLVNGRWIHGGSKATFRQYWTPTKTSNRKYPVNPMMPMPDELLKRVETILEAMRGVHAVCSDVTKYPVGWSGTAYIDPPYRGVTRYTRAFDVIALAKSLPIPCYVSEASSLSPDSVELSSGRKKGGISGGRKRANREFLSFFRNGDKGIKWLGS